MIDARLQEDGDRRVCPFTAVIAEYKRHGDKAVRRVRLDPNTNRTKASLFYFGTMLQLEAINDKNYSA